MQDLDNSIVICDNNVKIQILKNINKIVNIKFMTMRDFIKAYLFDYDEKTILYLIKNYNISYDIALEYIENIYYIEDKNYNIEKLDLLVKMKRELISNKLLIFNNKFKSLILNKRIIIYNYNLSKFEKHILDSINNVTILDKEYNNYKPLIYEFNDNVGEIEFIATKISELIENGVDINKIKLTNVSNDYINELKKIFNFYNLKIGINNNISILSTTIGNLFYSNIDSGIKDAINVIEKYNKTDIYNKIINICNKYIWCSDIEDLKILIYHDLINTYIEYDKYTNEIEVVDYRNYDFKDCYVFMIGFNQGIIPKIVKDESYITDNIKLNYLDSTIEINKREKINTLNIIKNIENLIITYKLQTPFNTYYPSSLISELGDVLSVSIDNSVSYSTINSKLKLALMIDNMIKFDSIDPMLDIYYTTYTIPYNTYTHKFNGIDKLKLKEYISKFKSFNMSYTSMDNYNRCAFRFYVSKILNIKDDMDTFGMIYGNIFHHIIELALKNKIDISDEVDKYLIDNKLDLKVSEKFFINRLNSDIKFVIDVINKQNSHSKLNKIDTEKYISINICGNINFVGFIDKIVYDTFNGDTIASIIDYKTYVKKPSLKYLKNGIGLQLPTYMYLAKNSYNNIHFSGLYLQNVILNNKSIEESEKSLKLIGYSNNNQDILNKFDDSYKDSAVIDGLKVNNDGTFSANSLKYMLSDEDLEEITIKTENKIKETINNILDAKFDINPKYDKGNIGCEFCKYKSICFMKECDYEYIGGEENE